MDILSYLTELIKTRKEVGIIGLGTIYKKKSPGRYDAETHSFLPPSYVLDFTADVRERVALIEFISKQKNLSHDSSAFYVEQYAEKLQQELKELQVVDLGELGKLRLSGETLHFIPGPVANTGFEFYGLPGLKESATLKEQASAAQPDNLVSDSSSSAESETLPASGVMQEVDDQPVYDEISEPIFKPEIKAPVFVETIEALDANEGGWEADVPAEQQAATPLVEQTEPSGAPEEIKTTAPIAGFDQDTKEETGMPAYVKVIIAGAAILAIGVVIYLLKPELFSSPPLNDNKPAVNDSTSYKPDSTAKNDSVAGVVPTAATAIDTVHQDTATVTIPPVAADTATTWEVIGASVISQKEAKWAIEQFRRSGITAKIIPSMPGKRRIKISVATFSDEQSARAGRKELVAKLKNPELYIFQNKHTHK